MQTDSWVNDSKCDLFTQKTTDNFTSFPSVSAGITNPAALEQINDY